MKKEIKGKAGLSIKVSIQPLGDRVLIKELEAETTEKTAGGIFIPDTVKEDRGSKKGEVLAVGPGKFEDGRHIPMEVKVGDTVLYQWGDTIKIKDEEYVVVSESSLIAIVK